MDRKEVIPKVSQTPFQASVNISIPSSRKQTILVLSSHIHKTDKFNVLLTTIYGIIVAI